MTSNGATRTKTDRIRPPLKWAGGKFAIVERIRAALPPGRTLYEPFVGSAVVSLNVEFDQYRLSDVNADLVQFYKCLQSGGDAFIERCRAWFVDGNEPDRYYELRERFNQSSEAAERASLLLYLNRHGYNGLYRVNSKGRFNVPHGRYRKPLFPQPAMLAFRERAKRAQISCMPFDEAMDCAERADVVYCDPPYVPLSATADFVSYTEGGFGPADQRRLAEKARELRSRGVVVVISNHDTPEARSLYEGARIVVFEVRRSISRNGNNRGMAPELLAVFDV